MCVYKEDNSRWMRLWRWDVDEVHKYLFDFLLKRYLPGNGVVSYSLLESEFTITFDKIDEWNYVDTDSLVYRSFRFKFGPSFKFATDAHGVVNAGGCPFLELIQATGKMVIRNINLKDASFVDKKLENGSIKRTYTYKRKE
eukprot:GDKI01034488.1.p1 GENE.GDKI01034488.1~~GDKI01034488.1.p1  ORF type:complete len:141 (+),score=20.60 GDKI01034488.1:303-725(+)